MVNELSAEDIERMKNLYIKANPGGTMPEFGQPNQETLVFRDSDDRSRIVGFIHVERTVEVRAMVTDADCEYRTAALAIGANAFETCLRRDGIKQYYVSVPAHHAHVRGFYEQEGAKQVDVKSVRYMKKL